MNKTFYSLHAWSLSESFHHKPKTIKNARKLVEKYSKMNLQVAIWREKSTKSSYSQEKLRGLGMNFTIKKIMWAA